LQLLSIFTTIRKGTLWRRAENIQQKTSQVAKKLIGTYCQLLAETHWDPPQADDLLQARVACIAPFFREESVQAAAFGARHRIPVVTIDCKHDHDILSLPIIFHPKEPF
jgi:hypothetical protein